MEVLRTAILDFCRRKKGMGFSPSEVVQQLYPEDWEQFLPELNEVIEQMITERLIEYSPASGSANDVNSSDLPLGIKPLSKPK
jgi:hypothetical protein